MRRTDRRLEEILERNPRPLEKHCHKIMVFIGKTIQLFRILITFRNKDRFSYLDKVKILNLVKRKEQYSLQSD